MSRAIRLLVADDHELFRAGVKALLASLATYEVVAEAATGEEAVAMARQWKPDVILMDIQMPDMNGIEATRRILEDLPNAGVVILTMFDDDDSVFAAMRAGAKGYVLKGAGQAELMRAIDAVASGQALYNARIAERVLAFFKSSRRDLMPGAFPDLTSREREVLELIAQGLTNSRIARRLEVSEKTVRNHVSSIFSKMHVTDRVQAVVRARQAGFGRAEE